MAATHVFPAGGPFGVVLQPRCLRQPGRSADPTPQFWVCA
jgi:hypothetical protein